MTHEPGKVSAIATKLGVLDSEVISMNRRLSGPDASLNAPLRSDSESEWQDWLADENQVSQETLVAENEEKSLRMTLLEEAETDQITPVDGHRQMARAIGCAHLVVIPDAGHMTPMEAPGAVNRALRHWLGRPTAT